MSELKHFSKLADEWWNPRGKFKILHTLTPLRIKYIKDMLNNKTSKKIDNRKMKILDLGCGGGIVCEPLARIGFDVTGIDFVKSNIDIAKNHALKSKLEIKYIYKNINSLDLDKKYDVILLLEVLEHLDDWKNIIGILNKNLNYQGKLIISTINRNLFSKFFGIFVAENIINFIPKNTHSYNKLIKPIELTSFLESNNFNILDLTGLVFKPLTFEWVLKKNNYKINYFCSAIKN